MKETVYIVGHKNPDTDSIVSSIAYTYLKNRTDEKKYIAARAGHINEETQFVLKYFGVEQPVYISNVGTQVKDMEIRRTPGVSKDTSILKAWEIMKANEAVTLAVTDDNRFIEGIVTTGDIAKSYMDMHDSYFLSNAGTSYKNIAETVGGSIIVGDENNLFTDGKVIIGAAQQDKVDEYIEDGDLILLGDRYEGQLRAILMGAKCMILCVDSEMAPELKLMAEEKNCTVIKTPYDTFTVARLINQSIPVEHIMKCDELITFKMDEFTDNIRDIMISTRHRAFPVLNKNGQYEGTVSRRNLLGMRKKQLILVDHNEKSQAVDNIETAQVLEIIDHHRLGSLETIEPIFFRNQPVGCTATILHQMYLEQGVEIPKEIAGILCAAILSDTLIFRSPTCTEMDKRAAETLAAIADIKINEFAKSMFHAGSMMLEKKVEDIFYQDFKKFVAEGICFGVGQLISLDSEELGELKERILPYMEIQCGKDGMTQIFFMLTNIVEENTTLLFCGDGSRQLIEDAFEIEPEENYAVIDGLVSRKKQLIPVFMSTLQENE